MILIILFIGASFLAYSNGANVVTGLLVTTASIHGLPVSTTHVSVG